MLQLRDYQRQSLETLGKYLRLVVERDNASTAFYEVTERPYHRVPKLENMPYVCLRVPTGGGKTFMACHAVGIVAREFLRAERTLCLWLVPSNAIREQTLNALRNPRHSYRQALDAAFGGNVTVMDLAEALYLQRGTLDSDTVVVVTTLQSPRVAETDSRKVYEENGALQHHFDAIHSEASADQHSLRHSSFASHSARTTTLRASSTKDPSSSQSTSSTPSAT